jgi:hypothetical protein
MRLPAFSTSFVAVCLAIVTACGMSAVRTGAPRERERAVRMTRGTGQRLDSAEAVHGHEDTSVVSDLSGEPKSNLAARPHTDSGALGVMPARQVELTAPVLASAIVPLPPKTPPKTTLIPLVPGRAPPVI